MDELIEPLAKAKMFSKLHASSGHSEIKTDDEDIDERAFVRHHGLFKFTRILFELKNAPATFPRAINVVFFVLAFMNHEILRLRQQQSVSAFFLAAAKRLESLTIV